MKNIVIAKSGLIKIWTTLSLAKYYLSTAQIEAILFLILEVIGRLLFSILTVLFNHD